MATAKLMKHDYMTDGQIAKAIELLTAQADKQGRAMKPNVDNAIRSERGRLEKATDGIPKELKHIAKGKTRGTNAFAHSTVMASSEYAQLCDWYYTAWNLVCCQANGPQEDWVEHFTLPIPNLVEDAYLQPK